VYFRVRLCTLQTISDKEQFLSTLCDMFGDYWPLCLREH